MNTQRQRQTAEKTKPLSLEARKAIVADIAKTGSEKVRRGLALFDLEHVLSPKERQAAEEIAARKRERRRKAA